MFLRASAPTTTDPIDHALAYRLVGDRSPDFIRALMDAECMTIPANGADGAEGGEGEHRPDRPGPVFAVAGDGTLHMRYTNRARNILWRDDPLSAAAVACLKDVLQSATDWSFEGRLEPGWALICNNVLHTRAGFSDGSAPRLVYRARYYDRIAGT